MRGFHEFEWKAVVVRAPTLVLLNGQGAIVWRQDDVITDEQPLNIREVEAHIAFVLDGIKTLEP